LGDEVSAALEHYTRNHLSSKAVSTHTQIETHKGIKTAKKILEHLHKSGFKTEVLSSKLEDAISKVAGADPRTIRKYLRFLTQMGWIRIKILGRYGKPSIYTLEQPIGEVEKQREAESKIETQEELAEQDFHVVSEAKKEAEELLRKLRESEKKNA
jgi:hypothetical protein